MEEQETRWERFQRNLPLIAVAAVLIFAAFVGWRVYNRNHNRTDPVNTSAPAAPKCMAWIFDLEAAQVGDYSPMPITPAGRPMGTALFCNGTRPETEATVRIHQGEQTAEATIKLQSSAELKATGGVVPIGVLEPGLWELEYSIGGRTVAKAWVRADAL